MRKLILVTALLGILPFTDYADAATGLAVVTRDATVNGRLVKDVSPIALYATPKAGDYVRVVKSSDGAGAVWVTGVWKAATALTSADKVEVCTTSVAEETLVSASSGNCSAWDVVQLIPKDPRTFVLGWTQELKNTLGASMTPTGFRIKYGTDASALTQVVDVNNGTAREYSLQVPQFATLYYIAITAVQNAEESAKSNVISGTTGADPSIPLPPSVPVPPVLNFLTTATTAYRLNQSNNLMSFSAVGTVALNLPCTRVSSPSGGSIDVLKDRTKAVIDSGKSRPSAVVVSCSL